ncbi:MAG: hypothetical protein IPH20_17215 [Bacteroidales bacterium]|nr:hypothetical protein [Bacteroidales bacterium]
MKSFTQILAIAMVVASTACSKTDDTPATSDLSSTQKQEIISDTWVISSYIDKGKNETSNYSGYSFTFSDNGALTASAAGITYNGTWSIGSDHSGSDDSSHQSGDDNKLIITISGNYQMDELTDDFQIVSISQNEITLKDDNPTKIKELKFSKK